MIYRGPRRRSSWTYLLGAFAPRRGRRGTVAVGLGEAFAGCTAGGGVGLGAGAALDDLLTAIETEIIAVVAKFATEASKRDDKFCFHTNRVILGWTKSGEKTDL